MLVPDDQERLAVRSDGGAALAVDVGAAQWAYDKAQPAGLGTDTLAGSAFLYLPLRAPMRTRGVLAIRPENRRMLLVPEQQRQLDTFAALAAIALERVHYVEVAQQALMQMESERLRNSLLAALSHDLRTPLAALVGLAESLAMTTPALSGAQLETAQAIADEARRMSALVNNLLDMARIQSGEVKLRRQWQPFEEVVGSALKSAQAALVRHPVEVELGRGSAAGRVRRHADRARALQPARERRQVHAGRDDRSVSPRKWRATDLLVAISDSGPGVPKGQEEAIFEKFTRGTRESATPGVGLGLAISRAIVEAHRGRIWAENDPAGGARFCFTLPLGTPPAAPREEGPSERARRDARGHADDASPRRRSRCWSRTNARSGASSAPRWRPRAGTSSRPKR